MTIQKTVMVGAFALAMLFSINTNVIADCDKCQTQTSNVNCDREVKWAKGNPEEIAPGNTKKIAVKCGLGPYTWSVSGSGFSLAESQTAGFTNELIADATACGLATVTVVDSNNTQDTGYVRCTNGQWMEIAPGCPIPGPRTGTSGKWAERIEGKNRVLVKFGNPYTSTQVSEDECFKDVQCEECSTRCFTDLDYCHETYGCMQCIEIELGNDYKNEWPCFKYKYFDGWRWHCGVRCWCTKELRLFEWGCP